MISCVRMCLITCMFQLRYHMLYTPLLVLIHPSDQVMMGWMRRLAKEFIKFYSDTQ